MKLNIILFNERLRFIYSVDYLKSNLPILEDSLPIEIFELILHHFEEEHQCINSAI